MSWSGRVSSSGYIMERPMKVSTMPVRSPSKVPGSASTRSRTLTESARLAGDSPEITIEIVGAAAREGDRIALVALERAATALGLGVANTAQVLNPSLVVVCGRLARLAGEHLVRTVAKVVRQHCVETTARRLEIRLSPPKKDISAVGCALLAAEAEAQRIVRSKLFGQGQLPA